jgi:hypothetical protein
MNEAQECMYNYAHFDTISSDRTEWLVDLLVIGYLRYYNSSKYPSLVMKAYDSAFQDGLDSTGCLDSGL